MSQDLLETSASSLQVRVANGRRTFIFNRAEHKNSFDARLLGNLVRAIDEAEQDASCRMVVLEGQQGYFSTGLDFRDAMEQGGPESSALYVSCLRRLSLLPALVVASVDGEVRAGGLGFVAASDLAVATPRSTFALPEALWGLVPACVGLYLSRRIGPQQAKRMCLTTEIVSAGRALDVGIVDEVSEQPQEVLRRWWLKVARLKPSTMGRVKRYFNGIAGISQAEEARAMQETDRAMNDPEIRDAIAGFIYHGNFPWQS